VSGEGGIMEGEGDDVGKLEQLQAVKG